MVNGSLLRNRPTQLTLSLKMNEMVNFGGGRNSFDGREVLDTEEADVHFYGKGISESATLFPFCFVFARVHLICERNPPLIVRRKEPNLCVQE